MSFLHRLNRIWYNEIRKGDAAMKSDTPFFYAFFVFFRLYADVDILSKSRIYRLFHHLHELNALCFLQIHRLFQHLRADTLTDLQL